MATKKKAAKKKPSGKALVTSPSGLPFGVGDKVFIRTVTMNVLGRVRAIGSDFFTLDDAGWVADTGVRLNKFLAGERNLQTEFERAPSWLVVGRGGIIDAYPWAHEIPKAALP